MFYEFWSGLKMPIGKIIQFGEYERDFVVSKNEEKNYKNPGSNPGPFLDVSSGIFFFFN
jgi:hypothetical protein